MKLNSLTVIRSITLMFVFLVPQLHAGGLVVKPFSNSALTDFQKQAWNFYLAQESLQFGCEYGDDIRLVESPRETLKQLAKGERIEPIKVTLRTFLQSSTSVQELLRRNMYIASMECNKVYVFEDDLIGHPVLPYEEFLDILLFKLSKNASLQEHFEFIRGTKVASMDARWFWAFFSLDRDHHRLLGFDIDTVMALAHSLPGNLGDVTPFNSHYQIYKKVFSQGFYVSDSNECKGEFAEPSEELIVDKNITWNRVAEFYKKENLSFSGSWRPVVQRDGDGFTLAQSQAIEQPTNPYFNVNRRVTVKPSECEQ